MTVAASSVAEARLTPTVVSSSNIPTPTCKTATTFEMRTYMRHGFSKTVDSTD